MEKIFYISKLVNGREYVLCDYSTGMEWENVELLDDWGFKTTDRDEAQDMCDAYAEWNGSVEYFERIAA